MATNQITINFSPCSPAISYRVFYREIGDVSFIEWPDEFTSSPIVFEVEGPEGQLYEGLLVSVCEGDVEGPEVPWTGEPPISGEPGCCDPDVIDAVAETIIPDGSGSGSGSVGSGFLRLVYSVNMSGETVGDWNAFFGVTAFDSVVYSAGGTIVDLYNSPPFDIPGHLFENDLTLLRVLDFDNCVIGLDGHCFLSCENLIEVDLPACVDVEGSEFFNCFDLTDVSMPLVTVLESQLFASCQSLTNLTLGDVTSVGIDTFILCGIPALNFPNCVTVALGGFRLMQNITLLDLPSATSIGDLCFESMDNIITVNLPACTTVGAGAFKNIGPSLTTINLPVCSDLGGTTGDDTVFDGVTGNTITLTLLTATAGDGDVTTLQANNSVTLILV